MKKDNNTDRNITHFLIYSILFAIILIATGMVVESKGFDPFISSFLKQVGAAILSAGAVGLVFEYFAGKDLIWRATSQLLENLSEASKSQNKLLDNLEERIDRVGEEIVMTSGMLRNATAVGIQAVYNGREPSFHQDVARAIRESKDIVRILGISLADLCGWWGGKSEPHEAVDAVMSDKSVKVQILFSDPDGEGLRTRAKYEHPGIIYEDTRAYKQTMNQIIATCERAAPYFSNKVEIGLYLDTPTCFLVLTDELAFIEQYTYADRGGRNVLFAVKVNTPLFRLHADHFEALWRSCRQALDYCEAKGLCINNSESEQVTPADPG